MKLTLLAESPSRRVSEASQGMFSLYSAENLSQISYNLKVPIQRQNTSPGRGEKRGCGAGKILG